MLVSIEITPLTSLSFPILKFIRSIGLVGIAKREIKKPTINFKCYNFYSATLLKDIKWRSLSIKG